VKGETYFRELVAGSRRGLVDRLVFALLLLCSVPYALVMKTRAFGYRTGILPSRRLPRPVISVGNITVGGTGKTPTVLFIARLLLERGKRVVVLTRGYGGSLEGETRVVADGTGLLLSPAEAGDEPCLLASALPGLMVVMGPDRYLAGCLAMEQLAPDIFLLDDGFQHQRLGRDLDILLLDGTNPFATGRTLPAGLLREPPSAAQRADLVIFTRCAGALPPVHELLPSLPYCTSTHRLTGYAPLGGGEPHPLADLAGRRVIAFAGIADPAAFFNGLEEQGISMVATVAFPDHTPYGKEELEALGRLKQTKKANCLITTAKDAVKLQTYRGILGDCCVALLELHLDDSLPLEHALENTVHAKHPV